MKIRRVATVHAAAIVLVLLTPGRILAAGLMLPDDKSLPPLAVRYHRVETTIERQAATTRVSQAFVNRTDRRLEATWIFPLPRGASVTSFSMWMNGKKVAGELLEGDKARRTYEEIVRRIKDPGLLEYWENDLLRMRVFPIPPEEDVRVEVEFAALLPADDGTVEYVYPLRTEGKASKTAEDFSMRIRIRSDRPIRNVYSPTHEIDVTRPSEKEAVVGFERDRAPLDRDFRLLYGVSDDDVGMSLLTFRDDDAETGVFLLLVSPKREIDEEDVLPKDVVFVVDTSGSMKGAKLRQARRAVLSCVRRLPAGDRFEIVRFSTGVDSLFGKMRKADDAARKKAAVFLESMEARGGTAIDDALAKAFRTEGLESDGKRPIFIVFLTDGKPTIGETEPRRILEHAAAANDRLDHRARLVVFGVGDGVNVHLLDRLSRENRGVSSYVSEDQKIDREVDRLFSRLNRPVLADLKLEIDPVEVTEIYPPELPDLFGGSQLAVVGRYRGKGDAVIRLSGTVRGRNREFVYEASFDGEGEANRFIEKIWATRKVGYLLDQIRLNGEEAELKEEIVRLGRKYGIVTPYTSYLVLEAKGSAASPPATRGGDGDLVVMDRAVRTLAESAHREGGRPVRAPAAPPPAALPLDAFYGAGGSMRAMSPEAFAIAGMEEKRARSNLAVESGEYANRLSEAIGVYRRADRAADGRGTAVKNVAGRTFYRGADGVWRDASIREDMPETVVRFAGPAYFDLLREHPGLRPFLAIAPEVAVAWKGRVIRIRLADTAAESAGG